MQTTSTTKTDGHLRELRVDTYGTRPSWKRHGEGTAHFEATGHTVSKWVSLWITEHAETGASKRTAFTLDRAEATKLRDLLNEVLGDENKED